MYSNNDLKEWFSQHKRQLPWRETTSKSLRNPYKTWVSEIMLQQTRVEAVLKHYERWMNLFPTLLSLANATEEQVLQAWTGLGYYSRARNIHKTAQIIVEEHQGIFPDSKADIIKLPGIGPYTCGAILSLAFNQKEAIVDGNIVRIFSRLYAWDFRLESGKEAQKSYWDKAHQWAQSSPQITNEALMELGALVCTPKSPLCTFCPLQSNCIAFAQGNPLNYPPPKKKKASIEVKGSILVCQFQDKVLLCQPLKGALLGGIWTFPIIEQPPEKCLSELPHIASSIGKEIKHAITHHKITLAPVHVSCESKITLDDYQAQNWKWAPVDSLKTELISSLPQKALRNLDL